MLSSSTEEDMSLVSWLPALVPGSLNHDNTFHTHKEVWQLAGAYLLAQWTAYVRWWIMDSADLTH